MESVCVLRLGLRSLMKRRGRDRIGRREKLAQKVGRREKLAQYVGRREIYFPVPPPSEKRLVDKKIKSFP